MEFGLLGPLLVRDGETAIEIPGARSRAVLAAMLVRARRVVPADDMVELVWGDGPPRNPRAALHNLVMRLRQLLREEADGRIVTRAPGYVFIPHEADVLDLSRLATLADHATAAIAAERWLPAREALHEALALWRGEPFAGIDSPALTEREVPRLAEQRLLLLGLRAQADLRLGRHEAVIPELRALAAEYPLREDFHEKLMLALYHAGRQADALEAYQYARRVLDDELGVEPGAGLREVHQRILNADPQLALTRSADAPAVISPRTTVLPRQLPAAVRYFTGRQGELKVLADATAHGGPNSGAMPIAVIGGPAGIGKTALAVHFAHRVADRFPDGQLFVDLRGFGPSGEPMTPAEAMRRFLDALGIPARGVPADPDERAALYRSQLAGRRMLVLLDNARDAEQVRPLLPGSPGCLVLVTSRNPLGGLVALDGATPLVLGLLPHAEARELLARRLGRERVLAEEDAVSELIDLCARLPLALNIAAAEVTLHPRPLAVLVEQLCDTRQRSRILNNETAAAAAVRVVQSWPYHDADSESAGALRLFGLRPGDVDRPAGRSQLHHIRPRTRPPRPGRTEGHRDDRRARSRPLSGFEAIARRLAGAHRLPCRRLSRAGMERLPA